LEGRPITFEDCHGIVSAHASLIMCLKRVKSMVDPSAKVNRQEGLRLIEIELESAISMLEPYYPPMAKISG
jgi:hypothetical protein